jgi:hypothetical protein
MWRILLILPIYIGLVSCGFFVRDPEPQRVNAYLADDQDIRSVRRVMVLPFLEAPGVAADVDRVREAFIGELSKLHRFELVALPPGAREDGLINRGLARGRISTTALVSLSDRYNLDGVMLGTVTSYRAYLPPHLGLQVQLISIHSGNTIWAAEGHYDASDARTVEDLQHYFQTSRPSNETRHGVEIYWISPTKFASYVSYRLVDSWNRTLKSRN